MAIIDWQEIWEGRRGELEADKATRRYVRTFRAQTDNAHDGPAEILNYTALLALATPYQDAGGTTDLGAILRRITIDPDQDYPFLWLVKCEFSSEPYDQQQRQEEIEDPLSRPPIFSWDTAKYQRIALIDLDGRAIQNSAKCLYDPPLMVDDFRLVLTVTRNEGSIDPGILFSFQNAVNSDTFLGFAPGQAKCSAIRANSKYENAVFYWEVTYVFEFYQPGFQPLLLDQGMMELNADGTTSPILVRGAAVTSPLLLNGQGKPLNSATPNAVVGVTVTNAGAGYQLQPAPTVTFTGAGGTGSGAKGVVQLVPEGGGVTTYKVGGVIVTNGGTGYTAPVTVTISPSQSVLPGSNATATATLGVVPITQSYRVYQSQVFGNLGIPNDITGSH